jgi:hypothetical protein
VVASLVGAAWQYASVLDRDAAAIDWLLASAQPGIRLQARRDLLGETASDDQAHVLDAQQA